MQDDREFQHQSVPDDAPDVPRENGQRPARRPGRSRAAGAEGAGLTKQVIAQASPETSESESGRPVEVAPPATVVRAEQLLDEALVWGAAFGTVLARRAHRLIARAREEVEDLWAEAEAIRSQWRDQFRHRRSPSGR